MKRTITIITSLIMILFLSNLCSTATVVPISSLDHLSPSKAEDKPRLEGKLYGIKVADALVPETVQIPSGSITMGQSNANQGCHQCATDEQPAHTIVISEFELSRFEVTNAQYFHFAKATGRENAEWRQFFTVGKENYPVINVSWSDAQEYCGWLQALTGREYRLPTEAEWEYAARAGVLTLHITGSSLKRSNANYDNKSGPTPVGKFKPNRFGLYDMIGNAWEWCSDWYDENYYKTTPERVPQGPPKGQYRVLRGGSWLSNEDQCRLANRAWHNPGFILDGRGIRVAVSKKNKISNEDNNLIEFIKGKAINP